MPILIAVLLGLTGALIVAFPLLGISRERQAIEQVDGALGEVADRERQARQALREVELDYTLGALETGDYDALRNRYERRALAALRTRYQREQELDAQIERELDALRGAAAKPGIAKSDAATEPLAEPTTGAPAAPSRPARSSVSKPVRPAKMAPDQQATKPAPRVSRQVTPRDRRAAPRRKGGE